MSVRIFWVCAMDCMCTQTRPQFILSSKGVLGEWSKNPCKLQGKNPLYWKNSLQRRIEPTTLRQAGQRAQHTTNKLFQPYVCLQIHRHTLALSLSRNTDTHLPLSDSWYTDIPLSLSISRYTVTPLPLPDSWYTDIPLSLSISRYAVTPLPLSDSWYRHTFAPIQSR